MASNINAKLVFAIVAAALGSGFQHGYHTGVINIPEAVIKGWLKGPYKDRTGKDLEEGGTLHNVLWSVTTSIINIGGTIGGLLTGIVAYKFGPKRGLLLNNILAFVAIVLMTTAKPAKAMETMILGRLIIGINCGLNAGLCPMYLSEISPVTVRGAIGSIYQLVITISILVSQIVGLDSILGNDERWPYLFLVPAVFAVIQVVMLLFCTESPMYLVCVKGNLEKAENSLKWLRNTEDVDEEMTAIKTVDSAVKALPVTTLKDMFKTSSLRKPLIISIVMMLAQQFSGINAVIFYSTDTLKKAKFKDADAKLVTIGIGIVNVLMTVVSVFLVEIAGRKTLLLVGFGGMAIDMTLLAFGLAHSNYMVVFCFCIVLIYIYIILFAAGAGSIPWFLVSELFNQACRPTAVSLAVPTNWFANFVVTLTFPHIQGVLNSYVFLIFVGLNILFFVYILKMVPETKNKPIEEITSQFT